jgi:type II secretory pathway component PulC
MWPRIRVTLSLLVISVCCVVGVEVFYFFMGKYLFPSEAGARIPAQAVLKKTLSVHPDKRTAQENARIILGRNIFGRVPAKVESVPENIAVDELQTSSLDLELKGTALGVNLENTAIILNKKEKNQDIYHVGDSVSGAVIKQILRGKIILNLGGTDEILDMQEGANTAGKGPVAVSSSERKMQTILPPVRTPLKVEQMEIGELEGALFHDTDAAAQDSEKAESKNDREEEGVPDAETDAGTP